MTGKEGRLTNDEGKKKSDLEELPLFNIKKIKANNSPQRRKEHKGMMDFPFC